MYILYKNTRHPYNVGLTSGLEESPGVSTNQGWKFMEHLRYGSMPRCYHGISIIFVSSPSHVLSHVADLWDSEEFAFASGRLVEQIWKINKLQLVHDVIYLRCELILCVCAVHCLWHEHICFKATVWLSDARWESQGHSFDNVSVQLIQGIDHVHQDVIHFCAKQAGFLRTMRISARHGARQV